MLTDEKEIMTWVRAYVHGEKYCEFYDGKVNCANSCGIADTHNLRVQFGKIYKDFWCNKTNITDFKGFPSIIGGNLIIENNEHLKSFKNIHKVILKIGGSGLHMVDTPVESNILGLLLIDGLSKIYHLHTGSSNTEKKSDRVRAIVIINKHLGRGKAGVIDAQNEMIDAGLDAFAEL